MSQTMQARNAVSAKMAECYVTIDGNRYNFMSAINLEVTFEKNKTEIPILGRMKSTTPKSKISLLVLLQKQTSPPLGFGNLLTHLLSLLLQVVLPILINCLPTTMIKQPVKTNLIRVLPTSARILVPNLKKAASTATCRLNCGLPVYVNKLLH